MPKNKKMKNSILERMFKHNDYRHEMQVRTLPKDELPEEASDKMIVEGRAVTFNDPTVLFSYDGQDYSEIIADDAFNETDLSEAFMKYNHSDSIMAVARYKNGTLALDIRDDGVYVTSELANTTAGRDLYELVKRGDIDKMSFAFTIEDEEYDKETRTWTVRKVGKLYDVAAVTVPAYQNTDLYARRYDEVESRRKKVEALELEKRRRIAKIRLDM